MDKKSKLKYKILPSQNLIIDKYVGFLSIDEILLYKGKQTQDSLWNPHYNTLADMRDSDTLLDEEQIEKLAKYQITDSRWSKQRLTASLTNEANHIVFEKLFNMLKPKNTKVQVRAFSTLEASIRWLGINVKETLNIERILEELSE